MTEAVASEYAKVRCQLEGAGIKIGDRGGQRIWIEGAAAIQPPRGGSSGRARRGWFSCGWSAAGLPPLRYSMIDGAGCAVEGFAVGVISKNLDVACLEAGSARLYRLGGTLVSAHLLVDDACMVLVDTGLFGIADGLGRLLRRIGRAPREMTAILLTHGHLDHTGGASRIQRETGAPVWAHPADRDHVVGRAPYRGWARGCGLLEGTGRVALRFRPPEVTDELRGGQRLPWWGGLRVVHLPGHTPGHCGFFCERTGWLLSGDVLASYAGSVHLPPRVLNREATGVRASLREAVAMGASGVIPSHYDVLEPELHARRLRELAGRCG